MIAHWQHEKELIQRIRELQGSDRGGARARSTAPSARATSSVPPSCGSARSSSWSKQLEEDNAALEELQRDRKMLNEEVDRGGRRRGRRRRGPASRSRG